jgi:hypothetical protein
MDRTSTNNARLDGCNSFVFIGGITDLVFMGIIFGFIGLRIYHVLKAKNPIARVALRKHASTAASSNEVVDSKSQVVSSATVPNSEGDAFFSFSSSPFSTFT